MTNLSPSARLPMPECRQPDGSSPPVAELEALARLHRQGRYEQAEAFARSLTVHFPVHGTGWKMLGLALQALGQPDNSLQATQQAAKLMPGDWEAHFNLACGLHRQERLVEAVDSYVRTLELKPDHADAYNNLGNALKLMGHLEEAEVCCRQATALRPDMANAHINLGNVLQAQGKLQQAEACYLDALQHRPDWAEAYNNLAINLQDQGRVEEAQSCFRKTLALQPDWAAAHSNLLYCLSHDVTVDAPQLFAAHQDFAARFETPLRAGWLPHDNIKAPDRQLRIGFVSGDLCDHAVAAFLEPLLKQLSQTGSLSLYAYYNHIVEDDMTQRLRKNFAQWHAAPRLSDAELADKIRADRIDILIDLSGHTARNRLLTFARKPAPIQVSWIGYPGTTGLQSMAYYLCDRYWMPQGGLDWQFTEKPAYLPAAAIFQPAAQSPAIQALPALTNGYITFGSFNRPNKLNASVLALWSMLLHSTPEARLLLGGIPPDRQETLRQNFAREGIAPSRLAFSPRLDLLDYLALHHQVDICLDTYPYSGGTTTNHAAWMGVPTLTLAGETPASRSAAAEMNQLNLQGFIAASIEDFVSKGQYWREHVQELALIRRGMRERFEASARGRPELFAASLEAALRTMWQRWCAGQPVAPIDLPA